MEMDVQDFVLQKMFVEMQFLKLTNNVMMEILLIWMDVLIAYQIQVTIVHLLKEVQSINVMNVLIIVIHVYMILHNV